MTGKFYLVDSGYANRGCFLGPHRAQTYHLAAFRDRERGLGSPREVFNYTHASLRNVVERTFGVWKKRFPILRHINNYRMQTQVMIPVACAVLHNFIRRSREPDELYEQFDQDGVPANEIDPSLRTDDVPPNSSNDNADNNEGRVPNRCIGGDMNSFREMLTEQMWIAYQQQPWYR